MFCPMQNNWHRHSMNDLEKLFNGVSSDFFKHALKYVDFPPEDLEPSNESGEEKSESSFRSLAPQISAVLASSPSGFNGGVGSDASERKPSISLNWQTRVSAIETSFSRNTPRQNHYEDATGATRHSQRLVGGGKCSQCEITETTQWRQGPGGRTLCNACGMRYRSTGDPALQIDFPQDTTASNKTPNAAESSQGCKHLDASALESESHIPANAVKKKLRSRRELTSPSVAVAGKQPQIVRKCMHCGVVKTPQWRHGPMGRKTLCNACGVRYRSGDLAPEYRPAASPTFDPSLHSNLRSKVKRLKMMPELQTNREIIQTPPPPPGPLP